MKGKHTNIPVVHMLKGKNISVVSNKKIPVSIDGEIVYTNRFRAKISIVSSEDIEMMGAKEILKKCP